MSMRTSHPSSYAWVSPNTVPKDFFVKCYGVERPNASIDDIVNASIDDIVNASIDDIINNDLLYDKSNWHIEHWEIDYDLPDKSIVGLVRYTKFKTFEEAAITCELLGLKCVKYKWFGYPLTKVGDHLIISGIGTYIPEEGYDEFAERFYKEKLDEHYKERMNMLKTNVHSNK